MLFACKCLNITLTTAPDQDGNHPGNYGRSTHELIGFNFDQNVNKLNPDLVEFFRESIGPIQGGVNWHLEQPDLTALTGADAWCVYKCINCDTFTSAINQRNEQFIINPLLLTNQEEVSKLKASENFSATFRILMDPKPRTRILKLNETNEVNKNEAFKPERIKNLTECLHDAIKRETTAADDRIARYTEQQFTLLKMFREKAEQEYHEFASLINNVPESKATLDEGVFNFLPSGTKYQIDTPPATPESQPMSVGNSPTFKQQTNPTAISTTGAVPRTKNPIREEKNVPPKRPSINRSPSGGGRRSSQSYSEFMFDMEGMDNGDRGIDEDPISDVEESDCEEEEPTDKYDDGVPIRNLKRLSSVSIAKSLPISMPALVSREFPTDNEDDVCDNDNVDIAANIQALAKSVHGDAVFGDLPRPRLSSQI